MTAVQGLSIGACEPMNSLRQILERRNSAALTLTTAEGYPIVRYIEQGLTSHQTHYTSYRGQVFTGQMTQPTV